MHRNPIFASIAFFSISIMHLHNKNARSQLNCQKLPTGDICPKFRVRNTAQYVGKGRPNPVENKFDHQDEQMGSYFEGFSKHRPNGRLELCMILCNILNTLQRIDLVPGKYLPYKNAKRSHFTSPRGTTR